jgi:hypothetical protein
MITRKPEATTPCSSLVSAKPLAPAAGANETPLALQKVVEAHDPERVGALQRKLPLILTQEKGRSLRTIGGLDLKQSLGASPIKR